MNKDVIYIEPEDDITDIIAKIENSKQKIVAIVPPKKAGVFRSVVNIKLMAKAGLNSQKSVVLVTTDPSIMKLAAATKLPVTKDLQSAPSIPNADIKEDEVAKEEVVEKDEEIEVKEPGEEKEEKEEEKEEEKVAEEEAKEEKEEKAEEKEDEKEVEEEEAPAKKEKKKRSSGNVVINWIKDHKKTTIALIILFLLLVIFLIWAFAIAPAVEVFVSIKTDTNNFSEVVNFVEKQDEEDIKEGKIYLEERKIETENEVEFEATGKKNIGEKARGELIIYSYFTAKGVNPISAGTSFSISGLSFVADEDTSLSWQGDLSSCENKDSETNPVIVDGRVQCLISGRINVTAAGAGTKYNIAASSTGWESIGSVAVYSEKEMAGGSDNIITIVQQSDIEKAREELNSGKESENKEKLYDTIPEGNLIIESTFKQSTSAAVSTPAVDEEVKEGVKPTLKTTTTIKVYTVDKVKLEELIKEKINLPENKKIFDIRNVFVDGFKELDSGYTGKLKAVYYTGPKITEAELVDKIMGKGIGDARREIKDIEGVSDVKMEPSYPWVTSVPRDSNRISMTFEIKDQEGNEIKEKSSEESDDKSTEKTEGK